MNKINSLKSWHGLLLMLMMLVSFTSCTDDEQDSEAPYLEVNPSSLTFENGGTQELEISTNRDWVAEVEDAEWLSLSKTSGTGSEKIQVSVPEGTNGNTKINITISNQSGVLKSATVKVSAGAVVESEVLYNETVGNETLNTEDWPYVDEYTGWNKTGNGSANVVYDSNNTSVRSSGLANTEAYDGASGPNVVFFSTAPATFEIQKISLTEGQKNLQLTFGASRSSKNEGSSYDNSFNTDNFKVSISADGTKWRDITYEKNNGDADYPYWIFATANFTLKNSVSELYIKFTANESSVYRLDDITLSTGNGGQEIDLEEGGETPDPEPESGTTINKIINLQKSGATKLTEDITFEAIVCGDPKAGNASFGTLNIMTPDATTTNEAIVLYNNSIGDNIKELYSLGDKIKVSLKASEVEIGEYNGITQITKWGTDDITIINNNNTVTPIVTTIDKLSSFVGMPVTIEDITIESSGTWEAKTYQFNNLTIYIHKNASGIIGQTYTANTGSISGIVTVYKNNAQIMPRNIEDLSAFSSSTDEPQIVSVNPTSIEFPAEGGTQTITVTVANGEGKTLNCTGLSNILSATVNETSIEVTASANNTDQDIKQTLTITLDGTSSSINVPITVKGQSTEETPVEGSELFISEYIEGKSYEKYIEIYNPTNNDIDLSSYSIALNSNGGSEWKKSTLSGTLNSKSTIVFKNGQAKLFTGEANTNNEIVNFSGDDAVGLFKDNTLIDILGIFGQREEFGKDVILRRKSNIKSPSSTYNETDWDKTNVTGNIEDVSGLGSHTIN